MSKLGDGELHLGATNLVDATNFIIQESLNKTGLSIRFVNSYSLGLCVTSSDYRKTISQKGLNLPDGKPLIWSWRVFHHDEKIRASQLRGVDVLRSVLENSQTDQRHLFLGSTDFTLAELELRVRETYPNVNIAGFINPGKVTNGSHDVSNLFRIVTESQANIVWVSLGTPLQDEITTVLSRTLPGTFIGVGAAFGFLSGTNDESPPRMNRLGLEWVFRLVKEPRRLWKRYFIFSPLGVFFSCSKKVKWEALVLS